MVWKDNRITDTCVIQFVSVLLLVQLIPSTSFHVCWELFVPGSLSLSKAPGILWKHVFWWWSHSAAPAFLPFQGCSPPSFLEPVLSSSDPAVGCFKSWVVEKLLFFFFRGKEVLRTPSWERVDEGSLRFPHAVAVRSWLRCDLSIKPNQSH